jgi:hypothetical protein
MDHHSSLLSARLDDGLHEPKPLLQAGFIDAGHDVVAPRTHRHGLQPSTRRSRTDDQNLQLVIFLQALNQCIGNRLSPAENCRMTRSFFV